MESPTADTTLHTRVEELERTLAQARQTIDAVERRHAIDLALIEADAADMESARLLTEVAVAGMTDRDIKAAVADLRARKPLLFRHRAASASAGGAMSTAIPARARAESEADNAASDAARSGDRRALLRYLRARRGR